MIDDLISRKAAIDALLERDANCGVDSAEVIARLPSAQQWIRVAEKLPEEDGMYLVTTSKRQVQVHVFSHNGNSEEYWKRCDRAWMPMPEPYGGN